MSNQSTLDLPSLYSYLVEHSVREPELLRRLREETAKDEFSRMQIAPEQGQFMQLMVQLLNATQIIEVGTYTGYSSLCMAMVLPENGHIICCDTSEQWTTIAKRYWKAAGVSEKITLELAPASETLNTLLNSNKAGNFDLVFIDADKENYDHYYEQCLRLLRRGGLLLIDNVLWSGKVADEQYNDTDTQAIRALNNKIKHDKRVDICMLPMADGITMARKK